MRPAGRNSLSKSCVKGAALARQKAVTCRRVLRRLERCFMESKTRCWSRLRGLIAKSGPISEKRVIELAGKPGSSLCLKKENKAKWQSIN